MQALTGHFNWVRSIIEISNEKIVRCDQNGRIQIFNINNGQCIKTIEAHLEAIYFLAKLSDNKIISSSKDKTIKLWDIESGDCLKTLEGHGGFVTYIDIV